MAIRERLFTMALGCQKATPYPPNMAPDRFQEEFDLPQVPWQRGREGIFSFLSAFPFSGFRKKAFPRNRNLSIRLKACLEDWSGVLHSTSCVYS